MVLRIWRQETDTECTISESATTIAEDDLDQTFLIPDEPPIWTATGERYGLLNIDVPVNWKPELSPISNKTIYDGQQLDFTVNAIDPDGDSLVYHAEGIPVGASFDTHSGRFSWIPTYKEIGAHKIIFIATDNGEPQEQDSLSIIITVQNSTDNSGNCFIQTVTSGSNTSFISRCLSVVINFLAGIID